MKYDDVRVGQLVDINVTKPNHGKVVAKEVVVIADRRREIIYINDKHGGRRLCDPRVLSPRSTP